MDFPGHFKHVFQQLNQQRLHGQLCDCRVSVGGRSFPAHRSILAACSSHFRALLSSAEGDEAAGTDVDHGDGGGPCVLELDQEVVTPEAFSTLLEMIYTSTLTPGASNVMDVLLAASHLHLNTVVKACKLHLSKRDFPTSPPKGWRSVQQQEETPPTGNQSEASSSSAQPGSLSPQRLHFSLSGCFSDASLHCGAAAGMEVSHSGGHLGAHEDTAPPAGHKRTAPGSDDMLSGRKRLRLLGEDIREAPPTVTRSTPPPHAREEPPAAADTPALPPESRGEQEEAREEKYEAAKWESEERELPSQSDSGGVRGAEAGEEGPDAVVRVRVGVEKQEEEEGGNVVLVEVKRENLSTSSPDPAAAERSPSPDGALSDPLSTAADADPHRDSPPPPECRDGEACEEPVLGEGLDSLSELAFSCFLNPGGESVMGALEVEESLASLTAAAAAAETIVGAPGAVGEPCDTSDPILTSGSISSSSLVFPVAAVPLQQLLATQSPAFSDTLLLQPGPSPAGGFLGLRPASGAGRTRGSACLASGSPGLRRIAPKAPPPPAESEAGPGAPGGADRPALTRASDEVLSKCKKAAAEDHVVLVEGEKKYACGICCKTFVNLTDCKKHIRVHTGEKPYPCPKCGKRFSQSSHLHKHSKNTCLHWTAGRPHALADSLL